MELGGSQMYSKQPATCPYSEPDQFMPCHPNILLEIYFLIEE